MHSQRKRHLLVDSMGLLLAVVVTAASTSDPAGARLRFARMGGACKQLRRIWGDGTYRGRLGDWVAEHWQFVHNEHAVIHEPDLARPELGDGEAALCDYSGTSRSAATWRGRRRPKWRRSSVASFGSFRRSTTANTAASTKPMSASA